MALFLNLYLGHLLGDFLFQPGRLVLAKRDGVPGLLLHTGIVGATTAAVVWATLPVDWSAVVLVTGLHLVIERLTILTYLKTPTRGLFTLLFDQTLHALSIALVVWVAGGWSTDVHAVTFGVTVRTFTLAEIAGLVTVSLFGSILVYEARNALRAAHEGKGSVLRLDAARVAGVVERAGALALAVALHPAAVLLPFLPRAAFALTRPPSERGDQLVELAAGLALVVVVYAVLVVIAYFVGGDARIFALPFAPA